MWVKEGGAIRRVSSFRGLIYYLSYRYWIISGYWGREGGKKGRRGGIAKVGHK